MDSTPKGVYNFSSVDQVISEKVASNTQERSFYVTDMHDIYKKHIRWLEILPRIKPYYAIKCNNLPEIVQYLAALGTGFDCASKAEINQVLSYGVSPNKIVYANPCKTRLFIKHAKSVGVDLMTFDNELELHKVAELHPQAKLVIRITGDDRTSRCKFNMKFGADTSECATLLKLAKELNLNVMGVSFHNGSDCQDPAAYMSTIANCRMVFDMAERIGHKMTLLDIGGGFPGHESDQTTFEELAATINLAIDNYFPASSGVEIIAEPGRYYVASAMTLCSMVIAKRVQYHEKLNKDVYMYYLNDGIYGSFNNVLYEHATPEPELLDKSTKSERKTQRSIMWGPTCDSIDCIKRDFDFPELDIGEWVVFKNMGAYSCCLATSFNGFKKAAIIFVNGLVI